MKHRYDLRSIIQKYDNLSLVMLIIHRTDVIKKIQTHLYVCIRQKIKSLKQIYFFIIKKYTMFTWIFIYFKVNFAVYPARVAPTTINFL